MCNVKFELTYFPYSNLNWVQHHPFWWHNSCSISGWHDFNSACSGWNGCWNLQHFTEKKERENLITVCQHLLAKTLQELSVCIPKLLQITKLLKNRLPWNIIHLKCWLQFNTKILSILCVCMLWFVHYHILDMYMILLCYAQFKTFRWNVCKRFFW